MLALTTAQAIAAPDGSELIAVHCVDINQLEPVNEMYGHMAGDALLKAVAQRLRRVVRGENLVIHLNGDDFVIIQPNMAEMAEAEALAHQVVGTLDKSYAIAGEDIIITSNIGYAVDVQRGAELEQLLLGAERALTSGKRHASGVAVYDRTDPHLAAMLGRADLALYDAKRLGRDRVEIAPQTGSA